MRAETPHQQGGAPVPLGYRCGREMGTPEDRLTLKQLCRKLFHVCQQEEQKDEIVGGGWSQVYLPIGRLRREGGAAPGKGPCTEEPGVSA